MFEINENGQLMGSVFEQLQELKNRQAMRECKVACNQTAQRFQQGTRLFEKFLQEDTKLEQNFKNQMNKVNAAGDAAWAAITKLKG